MNSFWREQPALLFGLSLLVGSSSYLFWDTPWNYLFPLLWSVYLLSLGAYAPLLFMLAGALYSFCLYGTPPSGDKAYFSIASVRSHATFFQKGFLYRGMAFLDGRRIPCSVYMPEKDRPKADCDYILTGKWQEKKPYDYRFRAKEWTPVPKTWSLAELRYQMKERFRHLLTQKLSRPRTASFLSSLITGDVEDRSLRFEFSRLGLQHILAISGFHFAILIAFCSFFLGLFLSYRPKLIALLIAINVYFLFVGSLPAVQRSWLVAVLYLVGKLIGRHATGLNLLGVALTVDLLLDPLIRDHLGFQLSFLSCFGILFFLPLFPKRFAALATTLSVNIAILPLLLYHFHRFPLLSILYNLFFPFLVSAALFALLVSLLVHLFFPFLSTPFFLLTDWFTAQLLDLAAYPPVALDYSLYVPSFPAWTIPLYLFLLFHLTNSLLSDKIFRVFPRRS